MITDLCYLILTWLTGLRGRRLEDKAIGFVKTDELVQLLQLDFK